VAHFAGRFPSPALDFGSHFVGSGIALDVDVGALLVTANIVEYLWAASFGIVLGAVAGTLLSV
jgi:hypothetical protein